MSNNIKKIILGAFIILCVGIGIFYWYQKIFLVSVPISKNTAAKNLNDGVINAVTFNCANSKSIRAIFFKDRVELSLSDSRQMLLAQAVSASGARYANSDESFIFWNKGDTAFVEEKSETTFKDCVILNDKQETAADSVDKFNLNTDSLPLYPGLSWGEKTATTTDIFGWHLAGFRIDSSAIKDEKYFKLDTTFKKYYDDKLIAAGWLQDKNNQADGAGSSVWAYTKNDEVVVLSYVSEAINQKIDEPLSCPCNMTFSIFLGRK
ncbi:MAG: MliC family protein [Candidatus Falkowbacteria bacterium]